MPAPLLYPISRLAGLLLCLLLAVKADALSLEEMHAQLFDGHLKVGLSKHELFTYVWADPEIPRPYICNVFKLDGTRITRTHPPDPVADKGNDDHATFHPGIWLAFGDLNGADFWRLKARVRHEGFVQPPKTVGEELTFTVSNIYETMDQPPIQIARETANYVVRMGDGNYAIILKSEFQPLGEALRFGDQEEMGFGIRLATPLTPKHGKGVLRSGAGGTGEKETWGKAAAWSSILADHDGQKVGAIITPQPQNFRESWFHNRDYGLMVANPFGKKAMTAPDDDAVKPDVTIVQPGETLRLGFGVAIW
jgi:hypothetical protein